VNERTFIDGGHPSTTKHAIDLPRYHPEQLCMQTLMMLVSKQHLQGPQHQALDANSFLAYILSLLNQATLTAT